jgi:tetratricopeptide (TPR) repeat protein
VLQRAGWIAAARKGDWSKLPEMLSYLSSAEREEIWTASLVRLLRGCDNDAKWAGIEACLKDASPLVRAAAVEAIGDRPHPATLEALLAGARDDYRLVRVRAAAVLSGLPRDTLTEGNRLILGSAEAEYLASLQARPDDSQSHYNLGVYHMDRLEHERAVEEFDIASRFQPRSLPPLANRALAYAALGRSEQAEQSLRQALALEPGNAAVNLNLGMLLAELGKKAEAEQAFRTAFKTAPRLAAAAYNLGVMLAEERPEESLEWCRKAASLRPQEARYGYTLGFFLQKQGKTEEAMSTLEGVIRAVPHSGEAYLLLGSLFERERKFTAAAEVYRSALANPQLPYAERARFERLLRVTAGGAEHGL